MLQLQIFLVSTLTFSSETLAFSTLHEHELYHHIQQLPGGVHVCLCIFVRAHVRTPVYLSVATIFVQSTACVQMCVSVCALACTCEHLSICACLCDMMCMMCGSEAYLPPSYIICILLTACPLGVGITDAYCAPPAALVFMESYCYDEVHVWVLLWQTGITRIYRKWGL